MKMKVELDGIESVDALLGQIAPKEAKNLLRSTVHASAGQVAKEAKKHMSQDTGRMRASTKTLRRKERNNLLRSDVMVSKAAFYWRFREYGQGPDGVEDAMFLKATEWFRANMNRIFTEQFGKKLEARLARLARK